MNEQELLQYTKMFGVPGVIVLIAVREIMNTIRKKNCTDVVLEAVKDSLETGTKEIQYAIEKVVREAMEEIKCRVNTTSETIYALRSKIDDLYKWHDVRDENGAPVWYSGKRGLIEANKSVVDTLIKQNDLLQKVVAIMDKERE